MIAHIIDAVLSYHIVDSQQLLDYNEISRNSSIATKLNLGQYQHKKLALESLSTVHEADFPNLNDGQAWRVRVGKSLLPRPAVYLNFYSRVVSADHVVKVSRSLLSSLSLFPLSLSLNRLQPFPLLRTVNFMPSQHPYYHHPLSYRACSSPLQISLPSQPLCKRLEELDT